MSIVQVGRRNWRYYGLQSFVGGWAVPPQSDQELAELINFEIARDGSLVTRHGAKKLNTTSLGAAITVGMDRGAAGALRYVLVVFKYGTEVYYKDLTQAAVGPFTALTSPEATGNSRIRMESVEDDAGNRFMLFTGANYSGLLKWDGGAGPLAVVSGSPAGCRYIRLFNGRVYAAGKDSDPYAIWFSDAGKPESWPIANKILVPASRGAITGLERQAGTLIVFTKYSILQLRGDPPSNYRLEVLHENIGSKYPGTIATLGGHIVFRSEHGFHVLSGSVVDISERIRDATFLIGSPPPVSPTEEVDHYTWATLTPYRYHVRYPAGNIAQIGDPATVLTGHDQEVHVFDLNRFRAWWRWKYPAATDFGAKTPLYPAIWYMPDHQLLVFGGGDGNLYYQPIRRDEKFTGSEGFTPDDTNQDVVSTMRTRELDMGDSVAQKQVRKVLWSGFAKAGTVVAKMHMRDLAGNLTTVTMQPQSTNSPGEALAPGITSNRPKHFRTVQLEWSGANAVLRNLGLLWRPVRLSGRDRIA